MPIASLGLAEDLPALVERRYVIAEAENALTFSETQLAILHLDTVPFQLRFCPALSKKPVDDRSHPPDSARTPKPDPFENPTGALLIAQIPVHKPTHSLVLNKYPVIPQHSILATITYKEQTHLLDVEDLEIAYACLKAWETDSAGSTPERRLFAFFNSGEHSGASQAHRHIQFLPIEQMGSSTSWKPLIDLMNEPHYEGEPTWRGIQPWVKAHSYALLPESSCTILNRGKATEKLPFTYFHTSIPKYPDPADLMEKYVMLYHKAQAARTGKITYFNQNRANISYNLAMTTTAMAICPRTSESARLADATSNEDQSSGAVAVNGTILAGTLMVKTKSEWDRLRQNPEQLRDLLRSVGVPGDT